MKPIRKVKLNIDDRVKLKREDGDLDPVDLGSSGHVIESHLLRFGPYINNVFFYMGQIKEAPDWCVLATETPFTGSTRFFMTRKENLIKV